MPADKVPFDEPSDNGATSDHKSVRTESAPDACSSDGKIVGKREQTKLQNRRAILDAAKEVFSELGFGATTVRDIIRRTNLASGTFYNYFSSKEEIFEALLDESALRARPKLHEARVRAKTFDAFVHSAFKSFFDFLVEDRSHFALMRRNTGALRIRTDTPEVIAGFDELREDIEQGIRDGVIPSVDVQYLTASMVGVAFEIGDLMLTRDDPDPSGAAEFATALMLGGIKALPTYPNKES